MLDSTNQDVMAKVESGILTSEQASVELNYTWPLVMLACLGIAAFFIGLGLKIIDKKENLGLELPNVASKQAEEAEAADAEL